MEFSAKEVQLGIIQFGSNVMEMLTFEESNRLTYDSLVNHIDRIGKGQGGETNTAEALFAVKDILENGRCKNTIGNV